MVVRGREFDDSLEGIGSPVSKDRPSACRTRAGQRPNDTLPTSWDSGLLRRCDPLWRKMSCAIAPPQIPRDPSDGDRSCRDGSCREAASCRFAFLQARGSAPGGVWVDRVALQPDRVSHVRQDEEGSTFLHAARSNVRPPARLGEAPQVPRGAARSSLASAIPGPSPTPEPTPSRCAPPRHSARIPPCGRRRGRRRSGGRPYAAWP